MNREDLEERLIDYAVHVINILDEIPKNRAAVYLSGQLVRSSTSCALNYGEAQAAESKKDFIHKMKIVNKELRETYIGLRILDRIQLTNQNVRLEKSIKESNELISTTFNSCFNYFL